MYPFHTFFFAAHVRTAQRAARISEAGKHGDGPLDHKLDWYSALATNWASFSRRSSYPHFFSGFIFSLFANMFRHPHQKTCTYYLVIINYITFWSSKSDFVLSCPLLPKT